MTYAGGAIGRQLGPWAWSSRAGLGEERASGVMGIGWGLPQGGWSGENVHNIVLSDKSRIQNCICYLARVLELKGKPQITHTAFFE